MATQFKQRADLSFDINSQAVFGEASLENPNVNLDHSSSILNYDQVIYSYLNSYGTLEHDDNAVNKEPLVDVEQDTDVTPADSIANSSATLSNEQIIDILDSYNPVDNVSDGATHLETIRDEIENSISDDTSQNMPVVNIDQAIITTDPVNTAIDENDFYITSEVDNSVTEDFNFFGEASIGCPVYDLIMIGETFAAEPLIIDDASGLEEFITDETITGSYDQITPPLADEDYFSVDFFDITLEASEEPIEDYEMPNDVSVDDGSYIPTESIDDNADPLTEVTDEPFTIYSFVSCWTMDASYSLVEYIDEPYQLDDLDFSLAVCDISIDDLTFDDTPIDNLNEVAADDLTIIPLGLPISPDYSWGWGC